MSIVTWKPEIWSARLLRFLLPQLVFAQPRVMNRNYEGEIKGPGDTVHIRKFGTGAAIRNYVPGTAMAAPDRPGEGTDGTLIVDQFKAFYIAVDDVDAVQADIPLLDQYMQRTARNLAVVLDDFASSKFTAAVLAANTIGTDAAPVTVKADGTGTYTPYKFCVEARRLLQKQSTPGTDRWMVINSDLEAQFLNDSQFTQGGGGIGDAAVVRNGTLGRIAGFDVLVTESIPSSPGSGATPVANRKVIFGDGNYSLTWADQIVKTEPERLQGQFGDAVKGLSVYGAKVVEAESYGMAHVAGA